MRRRCLSSRKNVAYFFLSGIKKACFSIMFGLGAEGSFSPAGLDSSVLWSRIDTRSVSYSDWQHCVVSRGTAAGEADGPCLDCGGAPAPVEAGRRGTRSGVAGCGRDPEAAAAG